MNLAIFDLDNTLLAGDSDYLWGQFLVTQGLVDGPAYTRQNQRFYTDYQAGRLDIRAFIRFSLGHLAAHEMADLKRLRNRFIEECIRPIIAAGTRALLDHHRRQGDQLLIITATNRFVTEPIAQLLGIEELLATDPEIIDGRFTGELVGTPCFQDGKVQRLRQWLAARDQSYELTSFYSDSANDMPLLEIVDAPYAVDPCPRLRALATARAWPIISLRE